MTAVALVGTSLPPVLAGLLDEVHVTPDCLGARFGAHAVTATEPRDLEKRLGHLLYEVAHLRRREPIGTRARMVRDSGFEQQLAAVVPNPWVTVPVQQVVLPAEERSADEEVVRFMGVRVRVPRTAVLEGDGMGVGLRLRTESWHAALSPGFLLAHGPEPLPTGPLIRLYVSPRDDRCSVEVWQAVLKALTDLVPAHRAKVASVRWFHPRSDAITVYLPATSAGHLPAVVNRVPRDLLRPETSLLCRRLGDGAAAAEEPADPTAGREGLSFGEHRASLLAQALVAGARSGSGWRAHAMDVLRAGNVEPAAPWRNLAPLASRTPSASGRTPTTTAERR